MILRSRQVVYPEGDAQEVTHPLRVNQMVDLNGNALPLPLPTARMIVYRVFKITTQTTRNEEVTCYHLELMRRDELEEHCRGSPPPGG